MSTKTLPRMDIVVRVKLPSSAGYHSSPSGDTEYAEDYSKAMKEAMPPGFQPVDNPTSGRVKDADGFTWIRVRCIEGAGENQLAYWIQREQDARDELARVKKKVAEFSKSVLG